MRLALLCAACGPALLEAQAPAAASLWDVAGTTLAAPPALERGATAAFWNPAAILERSGLRIGFQSVQTPDILGLSAVMLGIHQSLGRGIGVGLLFGRVQASDLVRTTTSPVSVEEEIPVYEQFLGASLGGEIGPVRLAGTVRGHDAQFYIFRESGFTLDLGAVARILPRVRIAISSQFVPADFSGGHGDLYYGGIEWTPPAVPKLPGLQAAARYGAVLRQRRDLEHHLAAGILLGSHLEVEVAAVRERSHGAAVWRPVLAVALQAGRYRVLAARGGGVRDLGANYRVGIDVDLVP